MDIFSTKSLKELDYPGALTKGDSGIGVKRLQEWLCLRGASVQVDGDFGPATLLALNVYCRRKGRSELLSSLPSEIWEDLVRPMAHATVPLTGTFTTLGSATLAAAREHLKYHPLEVGGDNRGPWVRLYMDGNDGPEWKWCAGFATKMVRFAAVSRKVAEKDLPFTESFSCDVLAESARAKGTLLKGDVAAQRAKVRPGDLFLVRKSATDWIHVGIVTSVAVDSFGTIEGNTNDEGSANGYEVCARTRGWASKDFISLSR